MQPAQGLCPMFLLNFPERTKKAACFHRPLCFGGDTRIRTGGEGFADLCLTTWLCRQKIGAGYEARTRYLHLGKVALYQMS